ncbi:hypothetical protein TanjilG_17735 [Lupinus angustifolius]|uniref:BHLH domain-containing protein n=1 Tax=Lupinus angustifolius TaxID=3871 RepID=A0A1J7HV62_LUPAN|nr:PREDICTED: transcription factor bHLH30-like [Lupinus angustifolius]OIW16562.1 hypothetical protein TanjilG_17735 [Lupinus angustifolius]
MLPPIGKFYGLEKWVEDDNDESSGVGEGYVNPEPSRSLIKAIEMNDRRSKSERKSTEACRSHRDAERRRRQRINDHLTTLRSLLPNTVKSDKASLLAEVVQYVKRLRKQADDVALSEPGSVCSGSVFPGVYDEARVSYCDGEPNRMKVTMCCEDRPGLNRDLTQAIRSVRAKTVHAEMMTIGGRTKNVVVIQWEAQEENEVGALERALKAVIENRALVEPLMGRVVVGQKRTRDSYGWPLEVDYAFLLGTTHNSGEDISTQYK